MLVSLRTRDPADACAICGETHVESGVVHLPAGIALQLLALAITISISLVLVFDFGRSSRLVGLTCLYRAPYLAFPDPPPTGL